LNNTSSHLQVVSISEDERLRMGPQAFEIFTNIISQWHISEEEARALLAFDERSSIEDLKRNLPSEWMTEDRFLRISYLVGIYQGLHTCHSKELADQWITLPNTNDIFNGLTPLAFMIQGGRDAMQMVRRLIDARCNAQ
jgi:hypothetical protein